MKKKFKGFFRPTQILDKKLWFLNDFDSPPMEKYYTLINLPKFKIFSM